MLLAFAFSGPSTGKAKSRRMDSVKARHSGVGEGAAQVQMRRTLTQRDTKLDSYAIRLLPNPERAAPAADAHGPELDARPVCAWSASASLSR